jgi:hypothetical protein
MTVLEKFVNRKFLRQGVAALVITAGGFSFAGRAGAAECKPTPEQMSIGMRVLQTELMVAGLKCSADQWNSYTAKFKTTIKLDADRMQKLFKKHYGKAGETRMNSFVTQLANEASQKSDNISEEDYCKSQSDLFMKVLSLTAAELERFSASRSLAIPAPVALCAAEPEAPPTLVVTAAPLAAPAAAH